MQNPQAIILKTAESQLNAKTAIVCMADNRKTVSDWKNRLLKDMRQVEDTGRTICSKKVLEAYSGMNVFKNESVQTALEEATVESEGDKIAYDLQTLRKKCIELGVAPKDIEILVNILRVAHRQE